MIVPSMNFEEIRKELQKELPIMLRKAGYVADDLAKALKPKRDEQYVRYFDYLSKYKNKWIYRVLVTKKRNYFSVLLYDYDYKGLRGLTMMGESLDDYIFMFTSHFFKRYNERRKLNLIKPNDILKAFMEDNLTFEVLPLEDIAPNMESIFCITNTGTILGTADTKLKLYRMNTFLTNDMLHKDQTKIAAQLMEEFNSERLHYSVPDFI